MPWTAEPPLAPPKRTFASIKLCTTLPLCPGSCPPGADGGLGPPTPKFDAPVAPATSPLACSLDMRNLHSK